MTEDELITSLSQLQQEYFHMQEAERIRASVPVELNEALVLALARARANGRKAYRIAAEAEVHPSELSKWTNGRRSPSLAQAGRICAVLGEPIEALFPDLLNEKRAGERRPVLTTPLGGTAQHGGS